MNAKIHSRTPQEMLRLINNIPFFESFNVAEKQELSALSNQVIEYSDKAAIVEEGHKDMAVFIILKGEAIVTRNDLPKVIGEFNCEVQQLVKFSF